MFTDIEGSTRLVEELGSEYGALLARHDELIRIACGGGGAEGGTQGGSFFAGFGTARGAGGAAIPGPRGLAAGAGGGGAGGELPLRSPTPAGRRAAGGLRG